jgi:hypothetical protein
MCGTIFVNSLRVGILCVYDIVLETLFHMYGIICVNSLKDCTLCVYDIILDLICLMRYDEIIYIDLEMYYER